MSNLTQRENLASVEDYQYSGFSYLENDMLFVKDGKGLSPQPFDYSNHKKGIIKNKWIGYPNKNAMLATFAYKFNQFIHDNTKFKVSSKFNETNPHDPKYQVLEFASVESRLARNSSIDSTQNKYSDTRFFSENDRILTYTYRVNYKILAEKLYGITNNDEDWEFGKNKSQNAVKNINLMIIQKRVRDMLNRFLEIQSKDTFNRYFGDCTEQIFTEFSDSFRSSDSLGVLFFTEVEQPIDKSIDELFEKYQGIYDQGEYDLAQYDQKDGIPDDFDTDPISDTTTLWYAPFEVQSISSSSMRDDEFVEIEILIPNGVRYQNEAQIAWLDTKCRPYGSRLSLSDCECDGEYHFPATYQIDGMIQRGLPNGFAARVNFITKDGYKRVVKDKSLTILGTSSVKSFYKSCDSTVPTVIDTELKYQQPFIFKDDKSNQNFIACDLLNRKTHTPNIGSKNRVRYQFTKGITFELERYAYKNSAGNDNEKLDMSTQDINIGIICREVRYV
ncbi:hypothetical protein [Lactococcus allomyrinae]|uniref:Uncharacterized protein n=1 Tax=Lactococcus allomyrinae TaxID=2419773 RepID=A0A387BHQ2_9LACT|nr:hypothetical protein [Lactococcus allomyrinae]AYG01712.1 hypothetical protein D7I46_11995 [Lactococcus allomyrinae]